MIYVIKECNFDNLENRWSNAFIESTIGYTTTKEKAQAIIDECLSSCKTYDGWDNEVYPKFKVEEIPEITE